MLFQILFTSALAGYLNENQAQRRRSLKYTLCHTSNDCFDSNERCTSDGFCLNRNGGLHGDRCSRNDQCARGHNCSRDQICVDTNGGGQGEVCTRNYHCKGSLKCINPFSGKAVVDGKKHDGECGRETPRLGRMVSHECAADSECGPMETGGYCGMKAETNSFGERIRVCKNTQQEESERMCTMDSECPQLEQCLAPFDVTYMPGRPVRTICLAYGNGNRAGHYDGWRRLEDEPAVESEEPVVAPEDRRRSYDDSNYCDYHSDCPRGEYCVNYPEPNEMTMGFVGAGFQGVGASGELRYPHMCSGDYNTPGFDLSTGKRYPYSGPERIVIGDWRRRSEVEAGPAPTM